MKHSGKPLSAWNPRVQAQIIAASASRPALAFEKFVPPPVPAKRLRQDHAGPNKTEAAFGLWPVSTTKGSS